MHALIPKFLLWTTMHTGMKITLALLPEATISNRDGSNQSSLQCLSVSLCYMVHLASILLILLQHTKIAKWGLHVIVIGWISWYLPICLAWEFFIFSTKTAFLFHLSYRKIERKALLLFLPQAKNYRMQQNHGRPLNKWGNLFNRAVWGTFSEKFPFKMMKPELWKTRQ